MRDFSLRQPVASGSDPTLGAVSQTQAKIYLLEQQLKQADLDLRVTRAKQHLQEMQNALRQAHNQTAIVDVDATAPIVLSVQGGVKTGGLTADLQFPDGSTQRVRSGDWIEQDWQVHAISPGQVILSHAGLPLRVLPLRLRPHGAPTIQVPVPTASAPLILPPVPSALTNPASIKAQVRVGAKQAGGASIQERTKQP